MQHMIEFIARYIQQKADFDIIVQTNESRIKEMDKKYEMMQQQAKTFQEDLIRHGLHKFENDGVVKKIGDFLAPDKNVSWLYE